MTPDTKQAAEQTVYVRVARIPHAPQRFIRCGVPFYPHWQAVVLGPAERERIAQEQMLELSTDKPAGFDDGASSAAALLAPVEVPAETPVAKPAKAAKAVA